jgi:hypothetical protein
MTEFGDFNTDIPVEASREAVVSAEQDPPAATREDDIDLVKFLSQSEGSEIALEA